MLRPGTPLGSSGLEFARNPKSVSPPWQKGGTHQAGGAARWVPREGVVLSLALTQVLT